MMNFADQKVYIAGHRGMVGSALSRAFEGTGCSELIKATSEELDLRNQEATTDFDSSHPCGGNNHHVGLL
ncbi:MAG: hypothetical protein AAGF67_17205, partial [Verrucomicrobiota bacterium]